MKKALEWLDNLAAINEGSGAAQWLDRAVFVFLILMVVSAPHSIAATQISWLIGMLLWAIRFAFKPRPGFGRSSLHIALIAFFGWTVLSSIFSYAPAVSLDKLRGAGLFLIVFFVAGNVRGRRAAIFVASALIFSAMVNVISTPIERLIGRGVEIHSVDPNGPLARAGLTDGDAILRVNGRKVSSPDEILAILDKREAAEIRYYRPDAERTVTVKHSELLGGEAALDRLGLKSWRKNRKWRATGFYGHFTTYSEVLQLIGSLVLGMILAGFFMGRKRGSSPDSNGKTLAVLPRGFAPTFAVVLILCLGLITLALLLSGTRASQLGLMVSAVAMVAALGSRRLVIAIILAAIPIGIGGYVVMQQTRQQDETNEYRLRHWQDGVRLATESPRHIAVGVGMDSIKSHWSEWGLFDGGRLPMGHFHSTPIQLAVERGLPALLIWLIILGIYARTMWRFIKQKRGDPDWPQIGIALGCIGGLAGFFTSGMVHYNLGDGEVAMVFYILMGIGTTIARTVGGELTDSQA